MDISKDRDAYKLIKLLQAFDANNNADLLYLYWEKTNQLEHLPSFLQGRGRPSVAVDEIQYVVALENLLEEFLNVFDSFLKNYCSSESLSIPKDAEVTARSKDLINLLSKIKKISFKSGWAKLYADFSKTFASAVVAMDRLIALDGTGKSIHFITNIVAEDVISFVEINFERKSKKYFILN